MVNAQTAIILAAGRGARMDSLTKDTPKSLLVFEGKPVLVGTVESLKKYGVKRIIIVVGFMKEKIIEALLGHTGIEIVENERYDEDVNIYSMLLAMQKVGKENVLIIEADTIIEEKGMEYILKNPYFSSKSVWFTSGPFTRMSSGGILKSDELDRITEIKIVPKYEQEYAEYKKLFGYMIVGINEIERFKALLKIYTEVTLKQYYLIPWINNLGVLPCIEGELENYGAVSYNTPIDYYSLVEKKESNSRKINEDMRRIEYVDVSQLKHVEDFSRERAELMARRIADDGVWKKPLYVDRATKIVMDGQHRMEAARILGLEKVPVHYFDYYDVNVWSLRPEEEVSVERVISRIKSGNMYPYKTVKHEFKNPIQRIRVALDELRK